MQISFEHIYLGDPGIARQRLGVYAKEDIIEIAATIRAEIANAFNAIPQYVPVGAVLPWLKTLAGTPQTLPPGFVECNGQQIDDKQSLMHGGFAPDLNTANRFLRGNLTSGGTGGSDTHSHSINLSTQGPSATVTAQSGLGATAGSATHTHATNFQSATFDTKPLYYNVVWIIRIK